MKTVWLLGDSIRMGYQQYVKENLADMNVIAPEENSRFSAYMLNSLRFWLPKMEKPDIIHFNVGLWDTACLYVDDGVFTKKEEYVKNVLSIYRELKRYNVPVIFALTTPVNAEDISAVATPSVDAPDAKTVFKQDNQRIDEYNKAVTEALRAKGAVINDLYSLVIDKRDQLISSDGIHMNEVGTKVLGDAVVKIIKKEIL
jgi:lysophospholipase L1-like esterase